MWEDNNKKIKVKTNEQNFFICAVSNAVIV